MMDRSTFLIRLARPLLVAVILAGLYAAGLAMRRLVLEAQQTAIGEEMPFTLESALHYRRIKMMYDRGMLPDVDPAIQYPEGIRIREVDSVASEPVQAFLARFFPAAMPFADRIRWMEAGWFCLSIPLLAVMLRVWTGSWWAGMVSGLLYAVSLGAVLRTTGQEISRENFAFPWLIAGYLGAAGALRARTGSRRTAWSMLAAAGLAMALIGWDMIQYVIAVIALGVSGHLVWRGVGASRQLLGLFAWLTAGVFLVALLHPYYRFHGLAYSPLMIWMAGILAGGWYAIRASRAPEIDPPPEDIPHPGSRIPDAKRRTWKNRRTVSLILAAIIFLPVTLVLLLGLTGAYGASYEHFAELIYGKIRFLNVKPADPSQLTFYQRIMWVPSLHSATWELTNWLFPFTFWIVGAIAIAAAADSRKRPDFLVLHWVLLFGVSVAAYVLMVRFHVFAALAVAVLAGWAAGRLRNAALGWRAAAAFLLALAVMAEANHTLRERDRMGRPNVYYHELIELGEWLNKHVAPDPVLGNMGVSAYVAAYGKCAIAIHPKFEDPSIRRRLERYGEIMFGTDERTLRDWMDTLRVRHLIYAKGEFAAEKPEYQMRYFVNHMDPPDTVPARRFEREDETMRYFTRVWGNRKYVVYRALGADEEETAAAMAAAALERLQEGDLDGAEANAAKALIIDRHEETALRVLRHAGSLREQGFNPGGAP